MLHSSIVDRRVVQTYFLSDCPNITTPKQEFNTSRAPISEAQSLMYSNQKKTRFKFAFLSGYFSL